MPSRIFSPALQEYLQRSKEFSKCFFRNVSLFCGSFPKPPDFCSTPTAIPTSLDSPSQHRGREASLSNPTPLSHPGHLDGEQSCSIPGPGCGGADSLRGCRCSPISLHQLCMMHVWAAHGGVKPTSPAELGGRGGSTSAASATCPCKSDLFPSVAVGRSVLSWDLLCESPETVPERAAQPELPVGFEEADLSLSRREPYSGMRATLPLLPSFITAN